jgi:hypothetical protein
MLLMVLVFRDILVQYLVVPLFSTLMHRLLTPLVIMVLKQLLLGYFSLLEMCYQAFFFITIAECVL